jgi:large subunit ribosomal protein L3
MGLLGKKIGMTQRFSAKGEWACLGIVQVGPCVVLDIKRPDRDGYAAIQLGFDEKSAKRTNKSDHGVFAKAKTTPKRYVREIRLTADEAAQFQVGQTLTVDQVFKRGDVIDVVGTSRGKGFQGVIKKYHFSGFRASHGTHEYFRHGGSIGCRLTPGHVHRGKRMPGQMGNRRVTVQNIKVLEVNVEKNLLIIDGNTPGAIESYVMIKQATKRPFRPYQVPVASAPAPAPEGEATQG